MPSKALVLDANILLRPVLGERVRRILESHTDGISFFIPETAYAEAESTWPPSWLSVAANPRRLCACCDLWPRSERVLSLETYADFEIEARKRLASRDPDDWPILAAALALGCPIWTEDTDFFGCGVATWTSASIGSFLMQ